jgi:archaeosine synthase beta-subunit
VSVATILLTNRECPWRCLMCDLWKHTLEVRTPPGAVSAQIREATLRFPSARRVKLYNAGSFFDPVAVPPEEHADIAGLLDRFERVVVECHPALVGEDCFRFARQLRGRLEVAMGLETIHPTVLPQLNKGMTPETFRRAAAELASHGIALRSFVLLGLPFLSPDESLEWCLRSVAFAFDCGSEIVSLVPTRAGNGALDALSERGEFQPPTIAMLEAAAARAVALARGIVLADLWDLDSFSRCPKCLGERRGRLERMNREQLVPAPVSCDCDAA